MSDELSPEIRRELLDDFYLECDESLTSLRAGLDLLEASVNRGSPDLKVLDALFRTTHSLKGICAIVGLRPAEQLAHAVEDLFRELSKGQVTVSARIVEVLVAAAQRLEKIALAHRQEQTLPGYQDLIEQLAAEVPRSRPAVKFQLVPTPQVPAVDPRVEAKARGLHLYRAFFAPSKTLDARGVNLAAIRQRLLEGGEILSATPVIKAGSVEFQFVVGLREHPGNLAAWVTDGVRFAPFEEPLVVEPGPLPVAGQPPSETVSLTPSNIVRVDLARLDELMRITGELVIHRSRLEDRIQQATGGREGIKEVSVALGKSLRDLRNAITRVRMVPMAEIFTRVPFIVRDLKRDSDKSVRVVLEGNQTEVDKYLVERLKEPLLHLVRNAFAHGIEPAAERTANGKPPEATITLRAKGVGESVLIQIRDDGKGINPAAVVARARQLGLTAPDQPDAAELLAILCSPGFSTRDQADLTAGRGVGMAVVATTVRELGGTLSLASTPGAGTEFSLKLPLTLSIADALIVAVHDQLCAVPQGAVDEIIQCLPTEIRTINQAEMIPYREGLLPILYLRNLFRAPLPKADLLTLLVVSTERGTVGLVVDRIRSQREIVIRPLSDELLRVPGISGATELGDGRPILILDANALTKTVVRPTNKADSSPRAV